MDGPTLETFCTELNGGASINSTLLFQFLNFARAIVEQMRPWTILRKTNTSLSVTAANTWQTAISLAGITDFSRFYDGSNGSIKLFDGIQTFYEYRQIPLDQRLQNISMAGTFVHDESANAIYLNGSVPFAGTLWTDYIRDSGDIENQDGSQWVFPSWSHALLGFMAVAMNKGGVDYDDINARMAPNNRAQAEEIIRRLEAWDNEKQLNAQQNTDPYQPTSSGFRANAINID